MMTPFICRGCNQPIMERYLMKVLDKSWHMQCVKCSECQCLLNERCFSRDSKLYCRKDFFKRYGTKCSGCNTGLCPEDLVRKAVNKVYHVQCFLCSMCRKELSAGEQLYLIQGERFLCERCYQVTAQSTAAKLASVGTLPSASAQNTQDKFVSPTVVHGSDTSTHSSIVIPHNPQSGVTSVSIANGKRTKPRTSITPQQLDILKQAYLREQRPTKQTREDLMAKTGLDMKVIQVWFQNRRSKDKRDANYREAMRDEPSNQSTPVATPPLFPQSPVISTGLPSAAASTPIAPSPSSITQDSSVDTSI